jgi:endonuclease YncB( thermonuclease family)
MHPLLLSDISAHDFFHYLIWGFRYFLLFCFLCLIFRIVLWAYKKLVKFFSWIFYSFNALPSDKVKAYVTNVIDGDTFCANVVNEDDSLSEIRVRVYFIDAPEITQPFGVEAGEYLRGLIENRTVVLSCKGIDQYGRVLADVFRGGVDIPLSMVKNGYAWVQDAPDHRAAKLYRAFLKAQTSGVGLWMESDPVQPRTHRNLQN